MAVEEVRKGHGADRECRRAGERRLTGGCRRRGAEQAQTAEALAAAIEEIASLAGALHREEA